MCVPAPTVCPAGRLRLGGPRRRPVVTLRTQTLVLLSFLFLITGSALAQDIVTEITVITGGSSSIAAPAGYTKIPIDLNQDAGGAYIYICYKKGVGAPITGLAVTVGGGSPPSDAGYERINVDLNQGAGGEFIYLWYTKDPACTTIHNLNVQNNTQAPPAGYTRIPVDLNLGAGGAFIYLNYEEL